MWRDQSVGCGPLIPHIMGGSSAVQTMRSPSLDFSIGRIVVRRSLTLLSHIFRASVRAPAMRVVFILAYFVLSVESVRYYSQLEDTIHSVQSSAPFVSIVLIVPYAFILLDQGVSSSREWVKSTAVLCTLCYLVVWVVVTGR